MLIVTGDDVNVEARLEQAAGPGEILLGEATYRLVERFASVEPVPPLDVKGKSHPIRAWRLQEVSTGMARWLPSFDSPLVGRTRELEALRVALDAVTTTRTCGVVTILGPPGVGKSRLTADFVGALGGVTPLQGRCLP